MKKVICAFCFIMNSNILLAQIEKLNVYLIPGQGSDYRVFEEIKLGQAYKLIPIHYSIPEKGMKMAEYAKRLLLQIDTSQNFVLIGCSLGGMLAVEINDLATPIKTIIISSAKFRSELPWRYRFQKRIPLYKLVPKALVKKGALILQPIVEPDRKHRKSTFVAMLKDKDKKFLKRTVAMILEWERTEFSKTIVHIHGNKDHTIPIQNVAYDYLVEDGSHMMTLTRANEISKLLTRILESDETK